MKIRRKLLFMAIILLFISIGIVTAQSSENYNLQRVIMSSGETSAAPNYKVHAVLGQPVTGFSNSPSYESTTGFLFPFHHKVSFDIQLPIIMKQ